MEREDNQHHLEWKIKTSKGNITVRAIAEINGNTLSLQDVAYSPEGKNKTGLKNEMQAVKSEFEQRARDLGFTRLELKADRISGANPGREVDRFIDLTKNNSKQIKEFQLHPDSLVRNGQNMARLQSLQAPYQTKESIEMQSKESNKDYLSQFGKETNRLKSLDKAYDSKEIKEPIKDKTKGFDYE